MLQFRAFSSAQQNFSCLLCIPLQFFHFLGRFVISLFIFTGVFTNFSSISSHFVALNQFSCVLRAVFFFSFYIRNILLGHCLGAWLLCSFNYLLSAYERKIQTGVKEIKAGHTNYKFDAAAHLSFIQHQLSPTLFFGLRVYQW